MIVIRLVDGTRIFAKKHRLDDDAIHIENLKYIGKQGPPVYIDDKGMEISRDAVDVFFIVHKNKESDEEISEN